MTITTLDPPVVETAPTQLDIALARIEDDGGCGTEPMGRFQSAW